MSRLRKLFFCVAVILLASGDLIANPVVRPTEVSSSSTCGNPSFASCPDAIAWCREMCGGCPIQFRYCAYYPYDGCYYLDDCICRYDLC